MGGRNICEAKEDYIHCEPCQIDGQSYTRHQQILTYNDRIFPPSQWYVMENVGSWSQVMVLNYL
jgi:hypothetical protein